MCNGTQLPRLAYLCPCPRPCSPCAPDTAVCPLPPHAGGCCATHADGTALSAADSCTEYGKWSRTTLHMAAVKADGRGKWAIIFAFLYLAGAGTTPPDATSSSIAGWAPATTAVIAAWVQALQALRELQATAMQGCWLYGKASREVWSDAWGVLKRRAP